jgi:hypothetical protein
MIFIVAGIGNHLIIEYANGPQDHLQADPGVLLLPDGAFHDTLATIATVNL